MKPYTPEELKEMYHDSLELIILDLQDKLQAMAHFHPCYNCGDIGEVWCSTCEHHGIKRLLLRERLDSKLQGQMTCWGCGTSIPIGQELCLPCRERAGETKEEWAKRMAKLMNNPMKGE